MKIDKNAVKPSRDITQTRKTSNLPNSELKTTPDITPNTQKKLIANILAQTTKFNILQILSKADQPLRSKEISLLLRNVYGQKVKRSVVYKHLTTLRKYGLIEVADVIRVDFVNVRHRLNEKKYRLIFTWQLSEQGRRIIRQRYGGLI